MKREIKFIQGHDCSRFECKFDSERCKPGSGGSHGKYGLEIAFYVKGNKGAVRFILSTGWIPQKIKKDRIGVLRFKDIISDLFPMPTDLGYHAYKPQYKGQTAITGKCHILGGKKCYYDGSSLNSNDAFYTLLNGGDEALWRFLEEYYKCCFEGGKYPNIIEYPKNEREPIG